MLYKAIYGVENVLFSIFFRELLDGEEFIWQLLLIDMCATKFV